MSEDKKDEIKDDIVEDSKDDEKSDLINTNVALLKAENKMLLTTLAEKNTIIDELTKKLDQATDLIEDDTKAALIADIAPKTAVPQSILALKTVEDLSAMKKVLDNAKVPAFRSGTPIVSVDRSPEARLASMFEDTMAKHRK